MVEPLPGARGGKGFKRTATLVPRSCSMVPDTQMDAVIGQMVANGLDEDAIHAALETNGKDRDPLPLSFLSPLPPPASPPSPHPALGNTPCGSSSVHMASCDPLPPPTRCHRSAASPARAVGCPCAAARSVSEL